MKITHVDTIYKDAMLSDIDRLADSVRTAVLGDSAKIKEYELALQQALEYRASSYSGDAPYAIKSWAEAKGYTFKAACDDIIAAADKCNTTLLHIRDLRLKAKEAVKIENSVNAISGIYSTYEAAIKQLA